MNDDKISKARSEATDAEDLRAQVAAAMEPRTEARMEPPMEPRSDARPMPPPRKGLSPWLIVALLLGIAAVIWWFFMRSQQSVPVVPAVSAPGAASAPAVAQPASVPAVAAAPAQPTIQHPIDPAAGKASALPALDASDPLVKKALAEWLGEKAVSGLLRSDDFVRRVVVTVDNLGREHAAPRLWPMNPATGRFIVSRQGGAETVAPENAARYQAVVSLATSMDPARAAALYREHYPLFQSAYRELGYPGRYFNDRLVEVIDSMLATPEPAQPLAVKQVQIKGELAAMQTLPFYDFADPTLESRPAGQKMMLRMGNEHARKVKAQLKAFRAAITKSPPPKG